MARFDFDFIHIEPISKIRLGLINDRYHRNRIIAGNEEFGVSIVRTKRSDSAAVGAVPHDVFLLVCRRTLVSLIGHPK